MCVSTSSCEAPLGRAKRQQRVSETPSELETPLFGRLSSQVSSPEVFATRAERPQVHSALVTALIHATSHLESQRPSW